MKRLSISLSALTGAVLVTMGTGCGNNSLTSDLNNLNSAAEAIATLQGNAIDAELLALTDDIEEVPVATDPSGPLPGAHPRPDINRMKEELGLTDDQVAQIEAIITATRDDLDAIHQQVRDGALTREQAREQIHAIREDKRAQIEAVLTPEQQEIFVSLRQQHGRQFNIDRLAEFLGLTDEQKSQMETIMQTRWEQLHTIREQVESGSLTREQAREQIKSIHESERDQLTALLTEDQLNKFLRALNHHRFGFGPRGFGRGSEGRFTRPGSR